MLNDKNLVRRKITTQSKWGNIFIVILFCRCKLQNVTQYLLMLCGCVFLFIHLKLNLTFFVAEKKKMQLNSGSNTILMRKVVTLSMCFISRQQHMHRAQKFSAIFHDKFPQQHKKYLP